MPIHIKVEASRCRVRPGDRVAPNTALGPDPDTQEPVCAGCHGVVLGTGFRGAEHIVEVAILPDPH